MEFVLPELRCATKSANLELNEKVKELQENGQDIYHLAFGQSPFAVPECLVNCLREHADRNEYLPVSGTLKLRKAIAQFHARCDDGLGEVHPDQILIGTGSKELIFLTMNIFNGDILLIAPAWTTYAPQARLAKQKCHIVQTSLQGEWKVTPELLTRFVAQTPDLSENRLMVLNNPGNPSGTCYTEEELQKLADICRQLNIIVLSDEIYGLFNFKGKHVSLAKLYPEGTLVTTGFSKWPSAGGWRVGYIIVPKAMAEFMAILQSAASQTFTCAPAPMQLALEKGLTFVEELDGFVRRAKSILQCIGEYCVRELTSVGVKIAPCQGGFYLMPDFETCRSSLAKRGIFTGKQMCDSILTEYQVSLLPGSDFLRPIEELTVRLCFVDFDGCKAMEFVKEQGQLDDDFVAKFAPRMAEGIKRLKAFAVNHA